MEQKYDKSLSSCRKGFELHGEGDLLQVMTGSHDIDHVGVREQVQSVRRISLPTSADLSSFHRKDVKH